MRELKFRVWDDENNIMIYFTMEQLLSHYDTDQMESSDAEDPKRVIGDIEQFTGLYDKNNKEIYEGDIVKSWYADGGIVHYDCGQFFLVNPNHVFKYNPKWKNPSASMPICGITARQNEVIGNVHENPELLIEKLIEKNQLG